MRTQGLSLQRDHLVHAVHRLELGAVFSMLCEMPRLLPEYSHTVLHETPLSECDPYTVMTAQAQGLWPVQTDRMTVETLSELVPTGAILYDIADRPGLGSACPALYYAYSAYDAAVLGTAVPCSKFAASRFGLDPALTLPPFLDTRSLRQLAGRPSKFTVALVVDDAATPYPYDVANAFIENLPEAVALLFTVPPDKALLSKAGHGRSVQLYPHVHGRAMAHTVHADTCVCCTGPGIVISYCYAAVEAMALGKPVICGRQPYFEAELNDREHVMLFDTPDEAVKCVMAVRDNPDAAALLAANGKLWASWQDSGIQAGKLKRMLRMVGA